MARLKLAHYKWLERKDADVAYQRGLSPHLLEHSDAFSVEPYNNVTGKLEQYLRMVPEHEIAEKQRNIAKLAERLVIQLHDNDERDKMYYLLYKILIDNRKLGWQDPVTYSKTSVGGM